MLDGTGATPGGRYVHTEGDANWWIPSGQIFCSPNPEDTPAQELAYARQHYFLPHRYRDPFHTNAVSTESFVTYDTYDLLVEETRDALGDRVTVGERNVDPTQPLVLRAQNYRALQPALVMDPNRNRSAVAFDALGMVVGTAVMGKPEEAPNVPGDRLTATFRSDLTQVEIDQFLANPKGPMAATLLDEATTRIVYDLTAYRREPDHAKKPPAVAATLARETHASEPVPAGGLRIQASFSYSDGFGREIQKKIQAEPETPGGPLRWVGSDWTIYNNKGKPVRQYEPFFSDLPPNDRHKFEFGKKIGVSPVLYYDPVERVVATLHPNHTWEKIVFDPWRQETWDVNDTVSITDPRADADVGDFFGRLANAECQPTWHALRTDAAHSVAFEERYPDATNRTYETRAACMTEVHAATPTVAHADSLGRTFLTVAHNKAQCSDPAHPPVEEFHATRIVLDIEGNQREVIDAKDRVVMRYDYDILGNRLHQASMEAGERWMLNDVAGKPLYAWDSRDHRFRTAFDPLRRPTDSFLSEGGEAEMRVSQTLYGETHPNYPIPETKNLRGKVVELRDQSGVVVSDDYDFKGNLRESRRRLAQDYKNTLDWPWPGQVPLEPETYTSLTRYDALNRPTQLIAPHAAGAKVNVIQPGFNDANLLEQVDVWLNWNAVPAGWLDPATASSHAVTNINYDAKGQRTRIDHGTQDGRVIRTSYTYDRETFRLTHLYTRRGVNPLTSEDVSFTDDCDNPQPPPPTIAAPEDSPTGKSCGLQNLYYTYDPAGNITHIRDDAQKTIYFRNQRVEPSADYTYDAIYRLIGATGREHLGQNGAPFPHSYNDALRIRLPHPNELNSMGRYCECYEYDAVGNIMEMIHRDACPGAVSWRRSYTYNETSQLDTAKQSNRLSSTQVGNGIASAPEQYAYDAHGNMLNMPHLNVMQWDFKDQLQMTQRQAVNPTDAEGVARHGERTWYVYDSAGQRVRKVTESAASQLKDERIYLGGFEVYRKNGANPLVRETLHIMDDKQRIALVETCTLDTAGTDQAPWQLIRYQFGNHLGSASLELDERAQIISYEEYAPYGSSTYQAVRSQTETPKRYRYTGKERDEETGFGYHGARYYVPWIGRWAKTDPLGIKDGTNTYEYALSSPLQWADPTGTQAKAKQNWVDVPGAEAALVEYEKWHKQNINKIAFLPHGWTIIGSQETYSHSERCCWGLGSVAKYYNATKLAYILEWRTVGPVVDFGGPFEGLTGRIPVSRLVTAAGYHWIEAVSKVTYSQHEGWQVQWTNVGGYSRGQGMWIGSSGRALSTMSPLDFIGPARGLVGTGFSLAARGTRALTFAYRVRSASRWRSVVLGKASTKELELWDAVLQAERVAIGKTAGGKGHLYAALKAERADFFILDEWLKTQGITWTPRWQRVFNRALYDRAALMRKSTHVMSGGPFTLGEATAAEAGAARSGIQNAPYWPAP